VRRERVTGEAGRHVSTGLGKALPAHTHGIFPPFPLFLSPSFSFSLAERPQPKPSMCGGCFPRVRRPAWLQLSKPEGLGKGRRVAEFEGGGGTVHLAKVRHPKTTLSVGTVREGMCKMFCAMVSFFSKAA